MEILEKINPVRPSRISDAVFNFLIEEILLGNIKPGEKIPPERVLAEKFSVHRNSVREALKKLEMLGLVEIRHGEGTFVSSLTDRGNILLLEYIMQNPDVVTIKILKDLIRMREVLECDAAMEAAINRTEEDLEIMDEILYQEAKHIADPPYFTTLDFQFHRAIFKASKNIVLQLMLNSIKSTYTTFTGIFFSDPSVIPYVHQKHEELYLAVKEKNPDLSVEIMKELLKHGEEHLLKKLEGGEENG